MVNGGLSTPNDFVRMVSSAAAKAFNVYPRKGLVAPGSDADVIVFDPTLRHTLGAATHHSAVDVNVYEGMHVTGKVRAVGDCGLCMRKHGCVCASKLQLYRLTVPLGGHHDQPRTLGVGW